MNLRPANNADADTIKHLVFSVLKEYSLKPDPNSTDTDLDAIEQHYFSQNGFFAALEINNAIVATVGLHRVDNTTCELRKMYCLPEHRGCGVGRVLMEFALAKARELGYNRVILETASPLLEAIGLYKKFGFKEFHLDHLSCRCDQAFELFLSNT